MTKEERIEFLIHKKKELNEKIKTLDDLDKFYSFVAMEIAIEENFVKEYPEMRDSFMLSRLKSIQDSLKTSKELMRKNKSKRAFEPFEVAFSHLNQDYDFVIDVFKFKNDL